MQKLLSSALIFLMSLPVLAAVGKDGEAAPVPVETVDMAYVVIFGLIFIGAIVGFLVYMWWSDRDSKKTDK